MLNLNNKLLVCNSTNEVFEGKVLCNDSVYGIIVGFQNGDKQRILRCDKNGKCGNVYYKIINDIPIGTVITNQDTSTSCYAYRVISPVTAEKVQLRSTDGRVWEMDIADMEFKVADSKSITAFAMAEFKELYSPDNFYEIIPVGSFRSYDIGKLSGITTESPIGTIGYTFSDSFKGTTWVNLMSYYLKPATAASIFYKVKPSETKA